MPLNAAQYRIAKALNKKQQDRVWSFGERPDASPDDPEYVKASNNLSLTTNMLADYEKSGRKVDDSGKLTGPPKTTRLPSEIVSDNAKGFDYHFEPSVTEARKALGSDPELRKRIHLPEDWTTGVSSPERQEPVTDPTSGQVVGYSVVPAQSFLDTLSEGSSAYDSYAEDLWQQRMVEAKKQGKSLQRYKNVHLTKQPVDFLAGGLEYNIDRRLAPAALGAADSMSMGQAAPLYDAYRDLADYELSKRGVNTDWMPPSSEDVINRSPGSHLAGELAGYALPGNPSNLIQEGLSSALGYGARGALGKAGVSALAGGAVNAVEGGVRDVSRGMSEGQGALEAVENAAQNVPTNALFGAGGGAVGDLIGQGVGAARDSFRDSPRMQAVNVLDRAGGGTDVLRGVVAPPDIRENVRQVSKGKQLGSPAEVAAKPIAPQIRRHLDKQGIDAARDIDAQMQEYFHHPAYADLEVSPKPLIDALSELANKGRFRSAVSRTDRNVDPSKLRRIGKEISNIGEVVSVPRAHAQAEANTRGGTIMDADLANQLFDGDIPAGYVAVVVGEPMTAQLVTDMENMIDRELGFARKSTGNDDPVYTKLNHAIKGMRDQFPYYVDEAGKLVPPPGWTPSGGQPPPNGTAMPSGQPPPLPGRGQKPSLASWATWNQQHPGGSVSPNTPRLPSSASPSSQGGLPSSAVDSTPDFIDSIEDIDVDPLPSSSMEVEPDTFSRMEVEPETFSRVEVEPDTFSRDYVEPIAGENTRKFPSGMPATERMGRLPKDTGPKRRDFEDYQEFMDARAEWRIYHGKAKAGDMARMEELGKAKAAAPAKATAKATEVTQDPPKTLEFPETKRSIAPEEATPLSLLAGNKLAMDAPEVREPTERLMRAPPKADEGYPDESLPGPMAKDWTKSTEETKDWYEDIVSPGRDPRSDEAKRMADLTNQRQAFDEAQGDIRNVEERLGGMDEETRLKSMLGMLSKKLGREVTKEDLVRAGLMAGGVAAAASNDSDTQDVGVGAMALGGFGRRGKRGKARTSPPGGPHSIAGAPKPHAQLTAELDDGTTVEGFSALRRKQHLTNTEMEKIRQRTGVEGDKATIEKMAKFNRGNNILDDEALLKVAKELGLEEELRKVAGTGAYMELSDRRFGMGGEGFKRSMADLFGLRGDKLAELLSGAPRNPFDRSPSSAAGSAARRFLDLTGGRVGARHGDDLQLIYEAMFPGKEQPVEERKKNATR